MASRTTDDGGQQPPEQVQPVPHKVHGAALFVPAGELQRHEERGDQQEDIDAAGNPAEPDVVADHHQDGEGTKALDFGAELRLSGPAARLPVAGRGWDRGVVTLESPSSGGTKHQYYAV